VSNCLFDLSWQGFSLLNEYRKFLPLGLEQETVANAITIGPILSSELLEASKAENAGELSNSRILEMKAV